VTAEAPTWIDAGLAREWQYGRAARYDLTTRWFVALDESCTSFVVLSGNAGHGSFGGDDTGYTAAEVASSIERCGTPAAGLETCPEFLEALERHARHINAKGTQLEILRARYLFDAMRARVAIAQAEDASPFKGYAQRQPLDDDAEAATLIIPWEAGHDS
jgi:hypothetical protein